jgi:hypothetical protein
VKGNLKKAITSAKQIDEQSKAPEFIRKLWNMWHGKVTAMV